MELDNKKEINPVDKQGGSDSFYNDILSFPEEKQHNRWSVSWSDLMMTMFILFAMMYVYQVGDRKIQFGQGPGKNQVSDQGSGQFLDTTLKSKPLDIFDQTKQAIKDVMVDDKVTIDLINGNAVKIILAGDLLFDPGMVSLKLGARYQLDQIAKALNDNSYMINISGHTDNTPSRSDRFPTNWELSAQRAVMVARYLTEVSQVDESRIFITGHSFNQPVMPNDSSFNRSLNRRVEIILTKQKL